MDIVTTAGSAADVLETIQTFPGVNRINEGSGMYVRGGDVSETVVIIDQATLIHPYKYESDTGGYFGMISPFLLSDIFFSSGAYSAKYGNALSSVLVMSSMGMPSMKSLDVGLGIAAISLGGAWPIASNKLGLRFSCNYSDSELLFRINNHSGDYAQYPVSSDVNLNIIYEYSPKSQFYISHFANQDDIAITYKSPEFSGVFSNETSCRLYNLRWKYLLGNSIIINTSFSRNNFSKKTEVGSLDIALEDKLGKWRTDFVVPVLSKSTINTGFEINLSQTTISGSIPDDEQDYSPGGEISYLATDYRFQYFGLYIEGETFSTGGLFGLAGGRLGYFKATHSHSIDPRLSIGYRIADNQTFKLAFGIYHQYPQACFRDKNEGNPNLLPMQSTHYVAGYEYKNEITNLRIEAYYKNYNNLILNDVNNNYSNDGNGFAYGLDLFMRGQWSLVSGWVSYSYLVAKRLEYEYSRLVPTDYDFRNSVSTALKFKLGDRSSFGVTHRYSTGKPYTPAEDQWNSSRLPPVQRLDMSFSYIIPLDTSKYLLFYCAVSNVLNKTNIYDYRYSLDYSTRTEIKSIFTRNIYFGSVLSF
ncbi:MAG: TonB-dependent receptor [candidate division Zixibacteria bacterium]|nr:TonB-dependent receptor [candidate division Zixibacteria bacterium]